MSDTKTEALQIARSALEHASKWLQGEYATGPESEGAKVQIAVNDALAEVSRVLRPTPTKVEVHFRGGPWEGQTYEVGRVVGPVFAVGDEIGNHYWLDSKSDPPTYIWDER